MIHCVATYLIVQGVGEHSDIANTSPNHSQRTLTACVVLAVFAWPFLRALGLVPGMGGDPIKNIQPNTPNAQLDTPPHHPPDWTHNETHAQSMSSQHGWLGHNVIYWRRRR